MLASFGPPGGHELHFGDEPHDRLSDFARGAFERGPAQVLSGGQYGDFGRPDVRSSAAPQVEYLIRVEIIVLPAAAPQQSTATFSGGSSSSLRSHSPVAISAPRLAALSAPSSVLAANLVTESTLARTTAKASASTTETDSAETTQRPLATARTVGSTPTTAAERKLLALAKRPAAVESTGNEGDGLVELDADSPLKRKTSQRESAEPLDAELAGILAEEPLRALPPALFDAFSITVQRVEAPPVDDGLIELLAADISLPPATPEVPESNDRAEPIQNVVPNISVVLELATAEDAIPAEQAAEPKAPPLVALH